LNFPLFDAYHRDACGSRATALPATSLGQQLLERLYVAGHSVLVLGTRFANLQFGVAVTQLTVRQIVQMCRPPTPSGL